MSDWRSKAAPVVRWGGVVIGLLFSVSGAWALVKVFGTGFNFTSLILYIYAIIFGLLLVVAELGVWPPLAVYFGFLNTGSGRAWFLFFIATLCVSNGLSSPFRGRVDHILLVVAGVCGIILSILGLIIRKDPAVVNREAVEVPSGLAGVFKRGNRGGASAAAAPANPAALRILNAIFFPARLTCMQLPLSQHVYSVRNRALLASLLSPPRVHHSCCTSLLPAACARRRRRLAQAGDRAACFPLQPSRVPYVAAFWSIETG
eukprot:IDg10932t1